MALLNTRERTTANTSFHTYGRGLDKRRIFVDDADRREFLNCFRRHLAAGTFVDRSGRPHRSLSDSVAVLAYCLMPNHFHFVIHQITERGLSRLFESALTGYVSCFNRRHGRSGPLFASPYRAVPKIEPFDLQTAIAYVHLNHPTGPDYKFCSHPAYVGDVERPDWVDIDAGLAVFGTQQRYERFIAASR